MTRGYAGSVLWISTTLVGCAVEPLDASESAASVTEALRGGVQVYAEFDPLGAQIPGSLFSNAAPTVMATRPFTGTYFVNVTGISPALPLGPSAGGNVQVVAVGSDNARCTLNGAWTHPNPSLIRIPVACRTPAGVPVDSGFSLHYARSGASIGESAYVTIAANAGIDPVTSWNSSGGTNTAQKNGTGIYFVFLNGSEASLVQGAIEVTGLSPSRRCRPVLRDYAFREVMVYCFDDAGAAADSAFSLNVAGRTGLSVRGVGAYAQVSAAGVLNGTYSSSSCQESVTTVTHTAGSGTYELRHTLMSPAPASYQVSAFADLAYCKVSNHSGPDAAGTVTVNVACYSPSGLPMDAGFIESLSTPATRSAGCGGCAAPCQGGSCVLGLCTPVTLAAGVAATSVAANASDVYFTMRGPLFSTDPKIVSVPRSGGPTVTRVTGLGYADSIVLGASEVFWTETTGVHKTTLLGGTNTTVAPGSQDPQPRGLALSGSTLFWGNGFASQLYSVATDGTASTALLPPPVTYNWYPWNIALDATRVYFIRDSGLRVLSVPRTGGTPTLLWEGSGVGTGIATSALATDGTNLYFATSKIGGRLFRLPVSGGSATEFYDAPGATITGIAVRDSTVFWTMYGPGIAQNVMSAPVAGTGPVLALASNQNNPNSLFVDATTVFYANADAVMKVAR